MNTAGEDNETKANNGSRWVLPVLNTIRQSRNVNGASRPEKYLVNLETKHDLIAARLPFSQDE